MASDFLRTTAFISTSRASFVCHTKQYFPPIMIRRRSLLLIPCVASLHCDVVAAFVTPRGFNVKPLIISEHNVPIRRSVDHLSMTYSTVNSFNGAQENFPLDEFQPRYVKRSTWHSWYYFQVELPTNLVAWFVRTMNVSESMFFFARFVVRTIAEKRTQRRLGDVGRRRLRNRLRRLFLRHEIVPSITETEEKRGVMRSLHKLDETRQKLVGLVGYDSSLLFPAFSYLILGALFKSVIPHFYSACISFVAAGEANRNKLMLAMLGLGLSSVFEALFTGLRGALFWIAGKIALKPRHSVLLIVFVNRTLPVFYTLS